jgi:hypothetical protein
VANIDVELWSRKSEAWRRELEERHRDTSRHERTSDSYSETGSRILELAKSALTLFIQQEPIEQARLPKILLSNCAYHRGISLPVFQ